MHKKTRKGDGTIDIIFKSDTRFRKRFFIPDSFTHPAKMDAQLLIWLVERYTRPGETILDPMAGSGTTMLACTVGRNVILVELEKLRSSTRAEREAEIVRTVKQLSPTQDSTQSREGGG